MQPVHHTISSCAVCTHTHSHILTKYTHCTLHRVQPHTIFTLLCSVPRCRRTQNIIEYYNSFCCAFCFFPPISLTLCHCHTFWCTTLEFTIPSGNMNILAFIFVALCILVAIALSISISRFSRRDARYTLQEEKRSGMYIENYYIIFKITNDTNWLLVRWRITITRWRRVARLR